MIPFSRRRAKAFLNRLSRGNDRNFFCVMKKKTDSSGSISLQPRFRVMRGREIAFGPGKAELLQLVAETGSIRKAASRMNMSYMRAWSLIQTMNACFKQPVIEA